MKKFIMPIVIGVVLLVGGSFYGGVVFAKSKNVDVDALPEFGGAMPANFSGGTFDRGSFGGERPAGFGGAFSGGEILSIDGETMTVKMADGGTKIVFISDDLEVLETVEASLDRLEVGMNVTVTGSSNDDGSVTASSIQLRPEGLEIPIAEEDVSQE